MAESVLRPERVRIGLSRFLPKLFDVRQSSVYGSLEAVWPTVRVRRPRSTIAALAVLVSIVCERPAAEDVTWLTGADDAAL